MGVVKKFFLILSIFATVLFYNNCSAPDAGINDLSTSQSVGDLQANGGGHPGKLTYDFFTRDPICTNSGPEQSLTVDYMAQNAELSVCNSNGQAIDDYSELYYNYYNKYFIYFQGKVFALNELHANLLGTGRIKYSEFCFNTDLKIDFSIQNYRPYSTVNPARPVLFQGLFVNGNGSLNRVEGRTFDRPQGGVIFRATDGSFEADIAAPGSINSPSLGRITYSDGRVIQMQCLTNVIIPDSGNGGGGS